MLKAVEILKLIKEGSFTSYLQENLNNIDEAIKELEEHNKEDEYMFETIFSSLSMGNKAQSIATLEVARMLKNRLGLKGK